MNSLSWFFPLFAIAIKNKKDKENSTEEITKFFFQENDHYEIADDEDGIYEDVSDSKTENDDVFKQDEASKSESQASKTGTVSRTGTLASKNGGQAGSPVSKTRSDSDKAGTLASIQEPEPVSPKWFENSSDYTEYDEVRHVGYQL